MNATPTRCAPARPEAPHLVPQKIFAHPHIPACLPPALPPQLDSRDAALGLQGAWCIEFAEIEQIIRAEVEVIKAFLSRPVDRFRAPYGKGFLTYPRQCVLIGTTNSTDYLRDDTGNRRFWPVSCQFAAVEWVAENREQLWAEAAAREASGEDHWLSDADTMHDAEVAQAERQQEDVWETRVGDFLATKAETTAADVLSACLMVPIERQGKREQMRIGGILKRAGWRRTVVRKGALLLRVWLRP